MDPNILEKYEAIIGLEVHAQLSTKSKAYSNDKNEYGSQPNSNVSVVSLGHPGTLPVMNKKTIAEFVENQRALAERVEVSGETAFFYCHDPRPLLARLADADGLRYVHRASNLEDVFIKLTGRELRD